MSFTPQDPKCMVGCENEVKWNFFLPLLGGAALAFLLMVCPSLNSLIYCPLSPMVSSLLVFLCVVSIFLLFP